jgi:hypothetical protein
MKVFLNEKMIEVDVQNIKSFKKFFKELQNNLNNNGMIVQSLNINGKKFDIMNLPDYDLENIDDIQITAEDINLVVINTLSEMIDYINKFIKAIEELCEQINFDEIDKFVPTLQKIITGLSWIFTGIKNCEMSIGKKYSDIMYNDKNLNENLKEFENSLNVFKSSVVSVNAKKIEEHLFNNLPKLLKSTAEIIKILFEEFKNNHFTIEHLKVRIDYFIDEFQKRPQIYEKIGEKIQAGSESEGIENFKTEIVFFEEWVEFLKKLERTFHNITMQMKIDDQSVFEINKKFIEKLKELSEAFENQDFILISDIIEYEINDYLEIYSKFLNDIKNNIVESKNK